MTEIKNLENVKVGDEFAIRPSQWNSDCWKLVRCSIVTSKQCEIGTKKYRKSDARELGGRPYHQTTLYAPTEEIKINIQKTNLINSIDIKNDLNLSRWSYESLVALKALIDKEKGITP